MKGLLFFGAFALLAFFSCKDIDVPYVPEDTPEEAYDEAWYADNATISSTDTHFAVTEEGEGTISFKAEGGSVVVYVDCGTEWTADDSTAGVFGCEVQEACITVTAGQNLAEEELYGTVTLMTAELQIQFATISITQNAYGAPEIKVEANEWHVPAVAATAEELATEIGVEATDDWEVESDSEWLTAEKGENSVSLTAAENETFEERVAEVVLTCTDGYNSDSETVTVTQDARAYITLSDEEFEFNKKGGEFEVTVESNYEWSYAYESDWFTVAENTDGSLTITVDVNRTGDDREGTVTFTAGDGAANVTETTLSITQGIEDLDALILEYTIPSENTTIQFPCASITAEVDWGDGITETLSDGYYPSHTYSEPGTYYIATSGSVGHIQYIRSTSDIAVDGADCLVAVTQWGDTGLTNLSYAFEYCSNLTSLPESPGPFENVGNAQNCFAYCTSLKEVPEDLFKNCTECINFGIAFIGCTNLVAAPTFEGLSKVRGFYTIFYGCTSLTTLPENIFSGCTAVTDFDSAFYGCTSLTTLPENMFSGCSAVTDFHRAFSGCTYLTSLPENMFSGCSAVTNFESTFYDCASLTSLPENIFSDCTAVTNFDSAFNGCSSLEGESPYTEIDVNGTPVKVHLYERKNYPDYFTAPTYYNQCFLGCTKLDDYNDIPSSWGGNGN